MQPGTPRFNLPGLPSYFGGKGSAATVRRLINILPPHDIYVEPFLGSGRLLRHKAPATIASFGMETDPDLCAKWCEFAPPDVNVLNVDALRSLEPLLRDLIAAGAVAARVLTYCDPPYLLHTRKNPKEIYHREWSPRDHIAFLLLARRLPGNVIVSHLPCPEYADALSDWHTFTFENMTRRGLQTEQVWCNYQPGHVLHEYTFVGESFREREQLKRQKAIIVRRFKALPPAARIATIELLQQLTTCDGGHGTKSTPDPTCS